ncbi:hypothetical protein STRAU_0237 [Streptomyces aurantiacus JA 4570]|uniref:Adenylate kinase n=1 Tax=Streptomyces aurantiacus JA 4570 TaxID=1286094 RepID=S3ZV82_9ACTN|nr:hypothetical protein STRAU_0237 [Streptomyces aurantiacus JA 4570]
MVVGCPGAGKTTFAVRLATVRGLPVHHLDDLYFTAGWTPRPKGEWHATLDALCATSEWIIDGNHLSTLARRLPHCDAVVVLDRAPPLCLASYLLRMLRYARAPLGVLPHFMRRPDGRRAVADRPLVFARFILTFRRHQLPSVLGELAARPELPVVRLRTHADARAVLDRLSARPGTRARPGPRDSDVRRTRPGRDTSC